MPHSTLARIGRRNAALTGFGRLLNSDLSPVQHANNRKFVRAHRRAWCGAMARAILDGRAL